MDSPFRRILAIATLAFLTAVPFAFAAEPRRPAMPKAPLRPATRTVPTLVIPDVRGQPYVFAEVALEDSGLSWHVAGGNGYAANKVVSQSPSPGTHVVDTGAPLVTRCIRASVRK